MTNKEIIQISKSKPKKSHSCVPLMSGWWMCGIYAPIGELPAL